MTAANDWTKEMATKGFPELKQLYTLLGAPKNVELFANTHFQHNYNYVSRAAFFGFINKHFKLAWKSRWWRRITIDWGARNWRSGT